MNGLWTSGSYNELKDRGFPCFDLPRSLLLQDISTRPGPEGIPASYFQLSRISGGMILGIGVHNCVCDLHGLGYFVRNWLYRLEALLCRRQIPHLGHSVEMQERHRLRGITREPMVHLGNTADGRPISLYAFGNFEAHLRARPTRPVVWSISPNRLLRLRWFYGKGRLNVSGHVNLDEVSDNALLCGLLWLCINKARGLEAYGLGQSNLRLSVSLREAQGLIDEFCYIGNACLEYNIQSVSPTRPSDLTISEAFVLAASAIHTTEQSLNSTDVGDVLDWLEIRPKFDAQTNLPTRLAAPDLLIHNQTVLDVPSCQWGAGFLTQPKVRVANGFNQGDCIFLAGTPDDEEFLTNLTQSETERLAQDSVFREFFYLRNPIPAAT